MLFAVMSEAVLGPLCPWQRWTFLLFADLRGLRIQLVVIGGAALAALLAATILAVFKPRGLMPFAVLGNGRMPLADT